jgi:hypothetical protein
MWQCLCENYVIRITKVTPAVYFGHGHGTSNGIKVQEDRTDRAQNIDNSGKLSKQKFRYPVKHETHVILRQGINPLKTKRICFI